MNLFLLLRKRDREEWLQDRCIVGYKSAVYYFKLWLTLLIQKPIMKVRRKRIDKLERELGFK